MEKLRENKNYLYVLLVLLSIVLMAVFFSIVPYNNDDFGWGSAEGIMQLKDGFQNYNGRYLSNLLTLAMTRSAILKTVVMTVVSFLLCAVVGAYAGKEKVYYFAAFFLLFASVLLSKISLVAIFPQTLTWVSGFTNYVPSTLVLLVYYYIVRNIFDDDAPQYRKGTAVWCLLIGLIGGLFVEHVTLFNCAFGVLVIFYTYLRFRRFYAAHISFLLGALLSAVVMFTNPSYGLVMRGEYRDNMRAVGFIDSLKNTLKLGVFLFKNVAGGSTKGAVILALLMAFGFLFLLVLPFFVTKKAGERVRLLTPLLCMIILTVPLLFTNSGWKNYFFTPRVYFPHYALMIIYVLQLLSLIYPRLKKKGKTIVCALLVMCIGVLGAFYCYTFAPIHAADRARITYIEQQKAENADTVYFVLYPEKVAEYVYECNLFNDSYKENAKLFYHLDSAVTIETITFEEYMSQQG